MPEPIAEKMIPRLLDRVNEYGASYEARGRAVDPNVDLVEELNRRGIDSADAATLRDPDQWPEATRSMLLHLVEAAEAEGARFSLEFDHVGGGEPASVVSITIKLRGA